MTQACFHGLMVNGLNCGFARRRKSHSVAFDFFSSPQKSLKIHVNERPPGKRTTKKTRGSPLLQPFELRGSLNSPFYSFQRRRAKKADDTQQGGIILLRVLPVGRDSFCVNSLLGVIIINTIISFHRPTNNIASFDTKQQRQQNPEAQSFENRTKEYYTDAIKQSRGRVK